MLALPLGLVFSQIPTLRPQGGGRFSGLGPPLIRTLGWRVRGPWCHNARMVDSVRARVQAEGAAWQIPPYLGSFYHPDARLYPANEIRLSEGRKERSVVLEALPIAPAQVVCGGLSGWWDSPLPLGKFTKCCNCCCLIVCTFSVYELKGTATFSATGSVSRTPWSFPRFPPAPRVCPACLLAAESLPKPLDILAVHPPWPPALGCTASCPKFFLAGLTGLGEV